MARTDMLTVFTYDIGDDRRRRRVAKVLEDVMVRVQESVFESWMTATATDRLLARLEPELAPGDSVRVYAVAAPGLGRCRQLGGAPIGEDRDFWLL